MFNVKSVPVDRKRADWNPEFMFNNKFNCRIRLRIIEDPLAAVMIQEQMEGSLTDYFGDEGDLWTSTEHPLTGEREYYINDYKEVPRLYSVSEVLRTNLRQTGGVEYHRK